MLFKVFRTFEFYHRNTKHYYGSDRNQKFR